MKLLEEKVALITGASRGIGKAIALEFAKQGCNIAFTDVREDENMLACEKELKALDAYFRATNYLSVGQLYLLDNPLLKRKLP